MRCAVVHTGGKQYRVSEGETIVVEKLPGEVGERIELGRVLMIKHGDRVYWGNPCVEGGGVTAQILQQSRAKKIIVFKHKRRKNYRKKKGHRQYLTWLRIENIFLRSPVLEETGEESVSIQRTDELETPATEEQTVLPFKVEIGSGDPTLPPGSAGSPDPAKKDEEPTENMASREVIENGP